MKKIFLSAVFAMLFATSSLLAAEETEVNSVVLNAFKNQFTNASDVEWNAGSNYFKASFLYNNNFVNAYYSTEGDFIATTRNISSVNLPMLLQTSLKQKYNNYWISDLYELAKPEGTTYFITLENADQKIILKSSGESEWTQYKKSGKV
jgi:hypothetical protein